MQLKIFIAAMVAACGIGAFAVAVVIWDRRRQWRLGGAATAAWMLGTVLVGAGLVAGSCMGLIGF